MEVEIGIGKSGRRAYGLDDIAIVPSRRTRDPGDVDISWELDAFRFGLPVIAAAMDGVVSPRVAIDVGNLGGLACLNLEGLWTRYEDPEPLFEEIAELSVEKATRRMQEIYAEPIKGELIEARIREIKDAGVTSSASLTPQRVERYAKHVLEAELDILVIQGTVVSAEHVSKIDRAAQPQEVHPRVRDPGDRRRLRVVLHRVAPHAHGRGRRARRCRSRSRVHHARCARHRRAAGHRDRRRRRRAHPSPRRDRRVRARHRRRRDAHGRRHRQGDRVRCRLGDDRLTARGGVRSAGSRLPLGHGHVPRRPPARRARARRSAGNARRDPHRARARERRHASTSSVRSARRWPPPATRRSRSSRRPRSWSRRRCRPRARHSSARRASAWGGESPVPERA